MPNDQLSTVAKRDPANPVALTLRFNEDLRRKIAGAASRSIRSINGEIIFRLKASFEQEASI